MRTDQPGPVLEAGAPAPAGAYDADIIILALNRFEDTMAAVGSARRQCGARFHILVLDQGSDPLVRLAFACAFDHLTDVAYYVVEQNLGVAGGRNLISSLGHGRVIIALDNDAVFETDLVAARAVRKFDTTPEFGALAFKILARDGVAPDRFSWGYPAALITRFRDRFDTVTFVGAGHAIRRATWKAAGGYDSSLFFTWEEYDFCLRAIALGWVVRYDGSLGVIHKISAEARVGWNARRTRFFVRNRLIIARKWGTPWLALAPRILGYLCRGVRDRRLAPTCSGILDAMRRDARQAKSAMPPAMRDYLARNDQAHRGSLWQRIRLELLAPAQVDG